MKTSSDGIELVKLSEGFRALPYLCPGGKPTIGYGHTAGVTMAHQPITEGQGEALLRDDLAAFEAGVARLVKVPLTQGQFDALVSFSFNVGLGALRRSTLLYKLNLGLYDQAAEQFLRWNKASGKPLRGLTLRRQSERNMFLQERKP